MRTAANTKTKTNGNATANGNSVASTLHAEAFFKFPDPPEKIPDEMTTYRHLNYFGIPYLLRHHFGNPETTIIDSEHYISREHTSDIAGLRFPDLLIAFDADPSALIRSNAYVISEQGKPPDFVLEIASRSTGTIDTGAKRNDYEALGIQEYWRFDETGEYHGSRIAGDRLQDEGRYEPIPISQIEDGILEGYSAALNLNLRWQHGELKWHDPSTGEHIPTFESEREARLRAQARAQALETQLRQLRTQ